MPHQTTLFVLDNPKPPFFETPGVTHLGQFQS
jgi:hypothetical protein